MTKAIDKILSKATKSNNGYLAFQEKRRSAAAAKAEREQKQQASDRAEAIKRREVPTLHEFVMDSWENVLHPSEVFKSGWYIEYFCEWLTVVTIGTLNAVGDHEMRDKLLKPFGKKFEELGPVSVNGVEWDLTHIRYISFNISPRCSKSTVITIDWPCWEWLVMPWLPFLTLSYDQALASDHSDLRRTIIRSDYYQELSGGMKLSNSKNRITEYANEHRGQMVSKGLNAGVTGGGGLRIICLPFNQRVDTDMGCIEIGLIVELRLPVSVATYDHDSGLCEYQDILEYEKTPARSLIKITVGERSVTCTEDHPIYVEGKGYIRADEVAVGDTVLILDG